MGAALNHIILPALVGLAGQEIIQWFSLRTVLSKPEHLQTLRDPKYWTICALMLLFGTAIIYFWVSGDPQRYQDKDIMVFGLSFPALVRKITASVAGAQDRALGIRWSTYLF